MAAISSNPFLSSTSSAGAPTANAAADSNAKGGQDDSGTFMQLVEGMIQGNTPPDQLPSNLAAFLLTGDGTTLEGISTDTKESESDDVDDESALAALAALLPGLQTFQPTPAANALTSGDDVSTAGIDGVRSDAMQTLLDSSQAALTGAMDDATLAADAAGATAADPTDAAGAQQPTNSAAHAQSMLQAHKAAEAAPLAASAEVRTPVGAQGWSDEIGTHLTMMAANGREAASLRLSPEHLGPLEIRISMKDGEASVMFNASNADTRSALEQSLPRLREMFASQGLVLGDAGVSRDGARDTFKPATFANSSRGSSDSGGVSDVTPVTLSRLGLVDTYV